MSKRQNKAYVSLRGLQQLLIGEEMMKQNWIGIDENPYNNQITALLGE